MKNQYPLVSIIMANWNGGAIYENCLVSLSKIKYPNWELVVIDNGSSDGTTSLSLNPKFGIKKSMLIKNKVNVGFAPANNQGVKKAFGDYFLLLNNDTLVDPDFLNVMVDKMEREPDLGVMQPKIRMMDKPDYLDNAGSFFTRIGFLHHWGFGKKDSKEFDREREVFAVKGACMLIRQSVLEKTGGLFDNDFVSYFEETDFCWRSWLVGFRVIYYPQSQIWHKVGFTIKRLDVGDLNFHYYKNRICSLIKNLSLGNLIIILPTHLFVSLGISLAFLFKGQVNNFLLIWKAAWWNVVNFGRTLKKRIRVQSSRVVSDKAIFEKFLVPIDWKSFYSDFKRIEKDLAK
jgi:GT2 family glycosyltransferase